MRPSNEQGIAGVLDTLPECKVVLDALESPDFVMPADQAELALAEHIGVRFRSQTQHEPRPPYADSYVELEWNMKPEFKIEVRDIDFVRSAASRVVRTRNPLDRVFNRVTGRSAAAKTILSNL